MSALTWVVAVLAATSNPYLDEGRAQYRAMNYDKAIERLTLARAVPTNTREERVEVFQLLAKAQAAVGKLGAAEETYAELLSWQPHVPVPQDAAPKLRAAFGRAKTRLFPPDHVRLRLLPSVRERVDVEVEDPWGQVSSVTLSLLGEDGTPRAQIPVPVENHLAQWTGPLGESCSFFVAAPRPSGEPRAVLGSPQSPNARVIPPTA
jgi:hypothetical protein